MREDAGERAWSVFTEVVRVTANEDFQIRGLLFVLEAVFLVLLACLRVFDVPPGQVSVIEAFAAWSLVRLLGSIPITPGGLGIVELALISGLTSGETRIGSAMLRLSVLK